MKNEIIERIEKWVGKNYGGQEMEDPSWNIESLAEDIEKFINEKSYDIFAKKDEMYLREDIENVLEQNDETLTDEQMDEAVRLYNKYEDMEVGKLITICNVIDMVERGDE